MTLIDPYTLVSQAIDCQLQDLDINSRLGVTKSWDSFGYLQILLAMEQHYGITIDEASVEKYKSMQMIVSRYEECLHE